MERTGTSIDPRAMWPLAYLTGRLGYTVTRYGTEGPAKDVISADLVRGGTQVHVDWFPRTSDVMLSQGTELLSVHRSFAELAEALERLP